MHLLEMKGLKRLAVAVVRQAYADLLSPCARMRTEAIDFFSEPSPWISILDLHCDFLRRRLAPLFTKVKTLSGCLSLDLLKSGQYKCAGCGTSYSVEDAKKIQQQMPIKEWHAFRKQLREQMAGFQEKG